MCLNDGRVTSRRSRKGPPDLAPSATWPAVGPPTATARPSRSLHLRQRESGRSGVALSCGDRGVTFQRRQERRLDAEHHEVSFSLVPCRSDPLSLIHVQRLAEPRIHLGPLQEEFEFRVVPLMSTHLVARDLHQVRRDKLDPRGPTTLARVHHRDTPPFPRWNPVSIVRDLRLRQVFASRRARVLRLTDAVVLHG